MGFLDDLWTALLTDDRGEHDAAVDRIADHEIAASIARSTLPELEPPEDTGPNLPSEENTQASG